MNRFSLMIYIIFFNYIFSNEFDTSFGKCSIIINNKNKSDLISYQKLIKRESLKLINEYGPIEKKPFQIIIPKTKKEFYKIAKTAPEWGIAITKSRENKIIIQATSIANISKNRFKEIIIHELNHLYIHRLVVSGLMPSWFIEGIAMKFSNEFSYTDKIEISKALWKQQIIPLNALTNFYTKNKYIIKLAYAQAASAVYALEYYYGEKITHQIINLLKQKYTFEDALLQITGDDNIDFQEKYEFYISKYFLWIFLLKTSNMLFIIFPFILILGYLIKKHHNKQIIQKWENEEKLMDKETNLLN